MTLTADKIQTAHFQPDEAWLESTLNQNWSRLYAILFRLVGDRAEAEDLALEAFWRLYRQPPAELSEQSTRGWLYRVGVNLGFNALRSKKRRQQYEDEAGRMFLDETSPQALDTAFEREQERQQVRHALQRMQPRSAQLLILRHSGLSYAELAAALGITPGSVGTLLARAEREFAKCYQALEGESHASR